MLELVSSKVRLVTRWLEFWTHTGLEETFKPPSSVMTYRFAGEALKLETFHIFLSSMVIIVMTSSS